MHPAAEVGSTPMVCSPGGYSVAPTATHRDIAKPAASPERTPWGRSHREGRGSLSDLPTPTALPTHRRVTGWEQHPQREGS